LHIIGYRKLDDNNVPKGYKSTTPSDPYPIQIFGEDTIPDNKIGKYINDEFNYYLNIYENICHFGLPYKDWTLAPNWLLDMYKMFKTVEKEYEHHQFNKQSRTK